MWLKSKKKINEYELLKKNFEGLQNDYRLLLERNIKLEEKAKENDRLKEENKLLIKENDELNIAVNLLNNEKRKKASESYVSKQKWLNGYYGEE